MRYFYSGLRTGFTPSSKVYDFRSPTETVSYVFSNLLATTVMDPVEIDEVIIITKETMDLEVERFKEAVELTENVKLTITEEFDLITFLNKERNENTVVIAYNNSYRKDFSEEKIKVLNNEQSFNEKIGIEISKGIEQRYWFDDYTLLEADNVFETNCVIALMFVKENYLGETGNDIYTLSVIGSINKSHSGISNFFIKNIFNYEHIIEVDYLNYSAYLDLESFIQKENLSITLQKPHSIQYGNSEVLNGFRSVTSLFNKLSKTDKAEGLVIIENENEWKIVQMQKRGE